MGGGLVLGRKQERAEEGKDGRLLGGVFFFECVKSLKPHENYFSYLYLIALFELAIR